MAAPYPAFGAPWCEDLAVASLSIRSVASANELSDLFNKLADWFPREWTEERRNSRFQRLGDRWPADRSLMLAAEDTDGRVVGGALGFRGRPDDDDPAHVTLRVIAVAPPLRRQGVGALLVAEFETQATVLGAREIGLGGSGAVPFYVELGYRPTLWFTFDGPAEAQEALARVVERAPWARARCHGNQVQTTLRVPVADKDKETLAVATQTSGILVMTKELNRDWPMAPTAS